MARRIHTPQVKPRPKYGIGSLRAGGGAPLERESKRSRQCYGIEGLRPAEPRYIQVTARAIARKRRAPARPQALALQLRTAQEPQPTFIAFEITAKPSVAASRFPTTFW